MTELPSGIYKHYSGSLHLLIGLADHTGTKQKLVIYVPMAVSAGPALKAMPLNRFEELVEVDGVEKPRFIHIGTETGKVFAQFYDPLSGYRGADRVDG